MKPRATIRRLPRSALATCLLAVVPSLSCTGATPWPPPPAAVKLGEDACASCRMIVSDGRFAAQLRTRDGAVAWFDDVGCLRDRHGGADCDPRSVFVASCQDESWVRGDQGFAVEAPGFATPMGFGIAVFATRAQAEAHARRHPGAAVTTLAGLLTQARSAPESESTQAALTPR